MSSHFKILCAVLVLTIALIGAWWLLSAEVRPKDDSQGKPGEAATPPSRDRPDPARVFSLPSHGEGMSARPAAGGGRGEVYSPTVLRGRLEGIEPQSPWTSELIVEGKYPPRPFRRYSKHRTRKEHAFRLLKEVSVRSDGTFEADLSWRLTDADLDALRIVAEDPAYLPAKLGIPLGVVTQNSREVGKRLPGFDVVIPVQVASVIVGRVRDDKDVSLRDLRVAIFLRERDVPAAQPSAESKVEANGDFLLRVPESGNYLVVAYQLSGSAFLGMEYCAARRGCATRISDVGMRPVGDASITGTIDLSALHPQWALQHEGGLVLEVGLQRARGRSMSASGVNLLWRDGVVVYSRITTEVQAGAYSIAGLLAGESYEVSLSWPRFHAKILGSRTVSAPCDGVNFHPEGALLIVRARGLEGSAGEGNVTVTSGSTLSRGALDEDASFALVVPAERTYDVLVTHASCEDGCASLYVPRDDGVHYADVQMRPSQEKADLEVSLRTSEGKPVDAAWFRVQESGASRKTTRSSGESLFVEKLTSAQGSYLLPQLPIGEYRIDVQPAQQDRPFLLGHRTEVVIQQGPRKVRKMIFREGGKIEVDLVDGNGEAPSALCSLYRIARELELVTFDVLQRDELLESWRVPATATCPLPIASGKYQLVILKEGFQTITRSIQVHPGETTLVSARLQRSTH